MARVAALAGAAARIFIALVRNQRISRQGQHFVENEEREQVSGHCNAHSAEQCETEADIETRLIPFPVSAHIADGVNGVQNPQATGNHGKHGAERLKLERKFQTERDFRARKLKCFTGADADRQIHTENEQNLIAFLAGVG